MKFLHIVNNNDFKTLKIIELKIKNNVNQFLMHVKVFNIKFFNKIFFVF